MEFTYDAYRKLLKRLDDKGYRFASYKNWGSIERCVILRHDIDIDIDKAVRLAAIEKAGGVQSTYFVLLTSDFYNVFSRKSSDGLKRIIADGHTIGLHFDETNYAGLERDAEIIKEKIMGEADLLSRAIDSRVDMVSMHIPSKFILEADLKIPGMINSYGHTYFKGFKYLSDSNRRWREPVDEIIESGRHERLHILIHPFWYNEVIEDIHRTISKFINGGNNFRYQVMESSNIVDMGLIMPKDGTV